MCQSPCGTERGQRATYSESFRNEVFLYRNPINIKKNMNHYKNNLLEELHRLTEAVQASHADIAPTYLEYTQLAFAIATDCGEAGRADFMSLCSLSPKHDSAAAEKLFSNALHTCKGDIHLGSVFHLAEMCGVRVAPSHKNADADAADAGPFFSHTCARYNKVENEEKETGKKKHEEEEKEMKGTEPLSPLPYFPQDHDWPEPLKSILSFAKTPAQHDVLLLGAMTVLGASLSHIVRCKYGDKWQYPCLQTFITGHAAAGKSVLVWVRKPIEPIHEEIRRQVAESMKAYRKELRAYEALGKARKDKEPPVAPPNRMFIIPGNNTGTGLLQNLIDSDGTGIICESEADTVSTAIGTEFGNWSDTLRKAFDHDRLSYNRRTDREYQEVSRSYLSVLLSGTPAQVKPLIPTAENGLFSRQNFYYMPRVTQWADQFGEDEVDVDEEFRLMGNEWKNTLDELTLRGLFTLKLTHAQHKQFNFLFDKLFHRSGKINGDEMGSSVIRLAVNACRMMSIVAILRSLEDSSLVKPDAHISSDNLKDRIIPRWNMVITDDDFHAVLALVEPLYLHATHVLSFLSSSVIKRRSTADKNMLFAEMEDEFTRRLLLEKAHDRRIPESTALTWLKRLTKQGALVSVDGKGTYHKN